jgi:P27 family predicted phage terminase small subunit
VPEPPEHLYGYAAAEWRFMAPQLHPMRLLTQFDLKVFEAYCVSYCRWREAEDVLARIRTGNPNTLGLVLKAPKDGELIENPVVRISRRERFEMLRYASEFGFSPAGNVSRCCVMPRSSVSRLHRAPGSTSLQRPTIPIIPSKD